MRGIRTFLILMAVSLASVLHGGGSAAPATEPFTNRLAKEKSPYLLQHAHNPVDWFPWGNEAFAAAKNQHKPIFLSIGYSTCHWCHVMERESFSDPAMAELINANFIPIKVDREERPDIDAVYMNFVAATTGSGGWPLTVFLTPDRQPFFGGTYFPPEPRDGLPGLKTLLENVHQTWLTRHDDILKSAENITRQLRQISAPPADPAALWSRRVLDAGLDRISAEFDEKNPGFGAAPKFPRPVVLQFLLHESARTGNVHPRDMALRTLRAMASGGIHDQLGGGFHRYSTDRRWFLPHFEKMLYDQAQIAGACVDAWQITRDPFYQNVARDIFDYVLRDMTAEDGRFFCAEDADSAADSASPDKKSEGAFYVWTAREIQDALGKEAAAIFDYHFGVEESGNVENDPRREFGGKNVLSVVNGIDETAGHFGKSRKVIEASLASSRNKLLEIRNRRPRPARDDKALTAWNGLMISSLARGAAAFGEDRYRQAALRNAEFLRAHLYDAATGTLRRSYRDGRSEVAGMLEDYAFYIQGLLDLYQATLDYHWLSLAIDLQDKQSKLFADPAAGGFFDTAGDDPSVLLRPREIEDNAEPSGNSVSALNLLRLARMTDDQSLGAQAEQSLRTFAGAARQSPSAVPALLAAYDFSISKATQIVIAGDPNSADTRAMLGTVFSRYLPNAIVLGADGGAGQQFLAARVSVLKDVSAINGKATAYVCEDFACHLPTSDVAELAERLKASAATQPAVK